MIQENLFYHGTHAIFDTFDLDFAVEGGFFFSGDKGHAAKFGPRVLAVRFPLGNLHVIEGMQVPENHEMTDIERIVYEAKKLEKDGVLITGFRDYGKAQDTVIIFDPSHIVIEHECN